MQNEKADDRHHRIKNEDRCRRNDSRGGCGLSAAAGPLLPTQPPPIAGRPSGGDRFIRLNPTESDRSIFQSQSKDMNLTANGKPGSCRGTGESRLEAGEGERNQGKSNQIKPLFSDVHAGEPPALREK